MTSKPKLIGSLAAGGAAVNSDFKSPFYFTGSIFKACIDVER